MANQRMYPDLNIVNNYIYLLREREFIKTKENVYKIGKTKQAPNNRLNGYPKHSEVILFLKVSDCDNLERELLDKFRREFKSRKDIGREYFEGNPNIMVNIINITTQNNINYDKSGGGENSLTILNWFISIPEKIKAFIFPQNNVKNDIPENVR